MSTEIKSVMVGSTRVISMANLGATGIRITGALDIYVRPADLLAAIEAEGIGVVVEGTLPPVTVEGDSLSVGATSWPIGHARKHRKGYRDEVLTCLALLRWLDTHPPAPEVDEADVEALAREMVGPDLNPLELARMMPAARNAIASGHVTVTR